LLLNNHLRGHVTRSFVFCFVILCFLIAFAQAEERDRPNVIVILADDLGYCDTELYGCEDVSTPNLIRIADAGVKFTDGYVTSPVCSPSRAALLTGRYQQRFGHEFLPPKETDGLPASEVTLADAMRVSDYVTGMVGKWHLGLGDEFNPTKRGFDEFFGSLGGATDYVDPKRADVKISRPGRPPLPEGPWQGRKDFGVVLRGLEAVVEKDYLTTAYTRESLAFIESHRDEPFFLYLPHLAVHQPLQVTKQYYDQFPHIEDESRRVYAAMTAALDDSVGAILDSLDEHELTDNTLLIFVSDNGAGVADYCTNEPLRMGKQTLFEGGVRVPFVMQWPGMIPAGETYEHPVSILDIFPTVMAAIGGRQAEQGDGVDLVPFLTGERRGQPHKTLYWRSGENWAIRHGNWKLIHAADRDWLYDLESDIGELNNRAQDRKGTVRKLRRIHQRWSDQMMDPAWEAIGVKSSPAFAVDGVQIIWPV